MLLSNDSLYCRVQLAIFVVQSIVHRMPTDVRYRVHLRDSRLTVDKDVKHTLRLTLRQWSTALPSNSFSDTQQGHSDTIVAP